MKILKRLVATTAIAFMAMTGVASTASAAPVETAAASTSATAVNTAAEAQATYYYRLLRVGTCGTYPNYTGIYYTNSSIYPMVNCRYRSGGPGVPQPVSTGTDAAFSTGAYLEKDGDASVQQAAVTKQTMHCWGVKRYVSLTFTRDQCLRTYPASQGWRIVSAGTDNGMWHVVVVRYINAQTPQSTSPVLV